MLSASQEMKNDGRGERFFRRFLLSKIFYRLKDAPVVVFLFGEVVLNAQTKTRCNSAIYKSVPPPKRERRRLKRSNENALQERHIQKRASADA